MVCDLRLICAYQRLENTNDLAGITFILLRPFRAWFGG